MCDNNDMRFKLVYLLTVYKIINNNSMHIVSFIKQHKIQVSNDKQLLKNKTKISEILYDHVKPLYSDILLKYKTFKKCPITEICRHVCDSLDSAKNISEKISKTLDNEDNLYKYNCKKCGIFTNHESRWIKHQLTKTHVQRITLDENELFNCENCKKCFLSRSFLWKHKNICAENSNKSLLENKIEYHTVYDTNEIVKQEIINELTNIIKDQQTEIQEKVLELHNTTTSTINSHNTTTTNNNNTNNNHFNLNFFLNETCKNAITIKEFIENIHVGIDTVEYTGQNGYVAGISKIITDELKKLGCEMRPIHCTDLKRETIYIKDQNGWEKDNEEKEKLNKTISSVARKNMNEINNWRTENPNCEVSNSEEYNFEISIMKECMGDFGSEKVDNKKICNRIAKCAHTGNVRGKLDAIED